MDNGGAHHIHGPRDRPSPPPPSASSPAVRLGLSSGVYTRTFTSTARSSPAVRLGLSSGVYTRTFTFP